MALVANATKISLNSTKTPSGFTDPGGANLSSSQPTYSNVSISVAKSVVENATKSTTFDKIRTDAAVGFEKVILDLLTANFETTIQTVTYNIDWKEIRNNQIFPEEFYSDTAAAYIATVDVYVVIS